MGLLPVNTQPGSNQQSDISTDNHAGGTVSSVGDKDKDNKVDTKKPSKFSALTRIFKPWKWKRRKKPSEKIVKKAVGE